ncbi:LpxI family protein [Cochlodiniinecator piscidefendens]|uniref:LpxI family protein n=1 Tax=Cochlodiniinecator piscidefendens TaxID=2715756 RepID=UPI00140A3F42|nr:UDP-2,3-diacylglucosamine diphosphatase LpxI [Cochlodiniinecator piscidefendens]
MYAIIAGQGVLPLNVAQALHGTDTTFIWCCLEGFENDAPFDAALMVFRIEQLGTFLSELKSAGVTKVCFAGAMHRPALDPSAIDAATMPLVPRMMAALQAGDDGALRTVIQFFEEAGFSVAAPHELARDLLPASGVLTQNGPNERDQNDIARGHQVLDGLAALDLGQGCVVQQGQVISIETLPGTDWMLSRLADAPFAARPKPTNGRGVFVKRPKVGQDLRIDMPVIGPNTVEAVSNAGLGGIAIKAGGVMVLEREKTVELANAAGLFILVQD